MVLVGLDVSSKTGFAIFEAGKLTNYGTVFPSKSVKDFGTYPFNFCAFATYIADSVWDNVILPISKPFEVVIEETNPGRNALSQRMLEFIHFCLISKFESIGVKPKYIRTGDWRSVANSRLTKEEKALNAKIARIKKQTGSKLAKIDGKVVGRKGGKHVAIRRVKELFDIDLPQRLNDSADAILLSYGYLNGAPVCDGTNKKKRKDA